MQHGSSVAGTPAWVDFEYYDLSYAVDEKGTVKLSNILEKLQTEQDDVTLDNITSVEFDGDADGITVTRDTEGSDWTIAVGNYFTGQKTLKIMAIDKAIDLNLRCQRVDITDLLTGVKIYEVGGEQPIGGSDGTPAQLKTSKQYELEFTFAETSGSTNLQFRDDSNEMIFRLPMDGENPILTNLTKLGATTMDIDLGSGIKVSGNQVTYDSVNNCIRIAWNTNDPNFQELTASPRATFTLRYKANIDLTQDIIRFNSDTSVTVIKDETYDVSVVKEAGNPDSEGFIPYTVTVTAIGDAKDIQVSDMITGDALTYVKHDDSGGVKINVIPKEGAATSTDSKIENLEESDKGFSLTIDQLADGEKAKLTYKAKVDYEKLSKVEGLTETAAKGDTLNTVSAKGTGEAHTSEHWFENGIPYVSVEKQRGSVTDAGETGKKRVQWVVKFNTDHKAMVAGTKLVDSIFSGPVDVMTYDQLSNFTVTRIKEDGTRDDPTIGQWGNDVIVTPFDYSTEGSGVSAVGETWTWRVPDGDTTEKFGYEITYYTIVDESHIAYSSGDSAEIGNKITEYHSGNTASGGYSSETSVEPMDLSVQKEFKEFKQQTVTVGGEQKTIRYAKWEIRFDRRDYALKGAYLEDIHPNYNGGNFERVVVSTDVEGNTSSSYSDYVENINGISVDGFYKDGSGNPIEELRVMGSYGNRTLLQFYTKTGENSYIQGLMAKNNDHQKITVTLYTRIDEAWVNNSVDLDWDIEHLNTVNLFANSQKATATATCAPTVKKIIKSSENGGKPVGYVKSEGSSTPLPVYKFKVKLSGVADMVKDTNELKIEDVFDTQHLRLLDSTDKVYDADTRVKDITNTLTDNAKLKVVKPESSAIVSMNTTNTANGETFTLKKSDIPTGYVHELTYYLVLKDSDAAENLVDERDKDTDNNKVLYNGYVVSKTNDSVKNKNVSDVSQYEALFDNTALIPGTDNPTGNTVDFKVDLSPIRKHASERNDGTDLVDYTIEINPLQLKLHNGTPYEMVDSYREMSVNFKSVKVTKCIPEENKSQINWTYHNNVGTFTIPDETYVVISYSAWPVGVRGETITMHNEASMEGYSDYTDTTVTLDADFKGSAASYSVNVFKFGNDDMTQQKSGAIFQLFELTSTGYQPMHYQAKAQTRNPASDDLDYKAITGRLGTNGVEIGNKTVTTLPTRMNHNVGDPIYFVTGTESQNQGIAEIKLSQRRDGVALEMHKQYALVEVVPPEGYAQEKTSDGGDFYWSFIIDTIDNFSGGKYVYRDGGMMSINNFQTEKVSLNLSKTWSNLGTIAPESVTFQLYRNGVAYGAPIKIGKPAEGSDWATTISDLDRADEKGKAITWTVAETEVIYTENDVQKTVTGADVGEHFDISVTTGNNNQTAAKADTGWTLVMPSSGNAANMRFTNEPHKLIDVTVTKSWPQEDTDKLNQIVFDLYRTTATVGDAPTAADLEALIQNSATELVRSGVVLAKDESGAYPTMTFELMERFKDTMDADSKNYVYDAYHYFVVEHDAAGHSTAYTRTEATNQDLTITNSRTDKEKGTLTVTKAVSGLGYSTSTEDYTFTVMNSGMYLDTDGTLSTTEKPHKVRAGENVIFNHVLPGKYTITETDAAVPGYTLKVTVDGQANGSEIDVNANKEVTIQNTYIADTTEFSFSKLWIGPADDDRKAMPWPNGKELSFKVYQKTDGGTEKEYKTVTVKSEQDATTGKYSVGITDSENDGTITLTGNAHNIYTIKLTALPKTDENGAPYTYYAVEQGTVRGFKAPQYGFVNGISADVDTNKNSAAVNSSVVEAAINQLQLNQEFEIPVSKLLKGWLSEKELNFDFELTGDGISSPQRITISQEDVNKKFNVTNYINLNDTLKYERSTNTYKGTYKFSVQEVEPTTKINGVTYDNHRYEVIFDVVYDWMNSQLKVTKTIDGMKQGVETIDVDGTAKADVTVTNTYDPGKITLKATKEWDDNDNRDRRRENVTFRVYASTATISNLDKVFFLTTNDQGALVKDEDKTYSLPLTLEAATASNNYVVTKELPKYYYDEEITYTVVEYYGKDSNLNKYYIPGGTPVEVYNNSHELVGYEVTATRAEDSYDYSVENKHIPETKTINVNKAWVNLDKLPDQTKKPTQIIVSLLADGQAAKDETGAPVGNLILNEENSWTGSWTNLPVNKKGQDTSIVYTVQEVEVPLGFKTKDEVITHNGNAEPKNPKNDTDDYSDTATVTNTYEKVKVTAKKEWKDENDRDGIRKNFNITSLQFTLGVASGPDDLLTRIQTMGVTLEKTLTNTNNSVDWTDTVEWDNLPMTYRDANGAYQNIRYEVTENTTNMTYTLTESYNTDQLPTALRNVTSGTLEQLGYTTTYSSAPVSGVDGTITVTNSHTPEKVSVQLTKVWNDGNNQDGRRPKTDVYKDKVHLFADDKEVTGVAPTITGSDKYVGTIPPTDYIITFSNLPRFNNRGEEITYTVVEYGENGQTPLDASNKAYNADYTLSDELVHGDTGDNKHGDRKYTATNSHTPDTLKVSVTKDWVNNSNGRATTPSVHVTLTALNNDDNRTANLDTYKTGENNSLERELKSENGWFASWENLPKYAPGKVGEPIIYSVTETVGDIPLGYVVMSDDNIKKSTVDIAANGELKLGDSGKFTNTYSEVDVKVTKNWDDDSNRDGVRPNITLKLTAKLGSANGDAVHFEADPNWKKYTEPAVGKEGIVGNGNIDANGVWTTTLTVANATSNGNVWSGGWNNLPKYAAGKQVYYYVEEVITTELTSNNYIMTATHSNDGLSHTLTNKRQADTVKEMKLTKTWDDDKNRDKKRPSPEDYVLCNLELYMQPEGDTTTKLTFEQDATNKKKFYIKKGSDALKVDGKDAAYLTIEGSDGHTSEHTVNDVTANYILSFVNMPVNENGKVITYSMKEVENDSHKLFGDGMYMVYATQTDADNNSPSIDTASGASVPMIPTGSGNEKKIAFALVNKHDIHQTCVKLQKTWENDYNTSFGKPEAITVKLLADNEVVKTTKLVGMNWDFEWSDLPVYKQGAIGEKIVYTVQEENVPLGYVVTLPDGVELTENTDNNITVTNTYTPGTLTVSKTVDSIVEGDAKLPFSFKVTLTNLDEFVTEQAGSVTGTAVRDFYSNKITATKKAITNSTSTAETEIKFTVQQDGKTAVAEFTLNGGEDVTFSNLPIGMRYRVEEIIPNDNKDDFNTTVNGESAIVTFCDGEITENEKYVHANFTNTRKVGDLYIKKTVLHSIPADANEEFDFTVTLEDASGKKLKETEIRKIVVEGQSALHYNADTGEITGVKVKTSNANSVKITGIPVGTKYTVTETTPANTNIEKAANQSGSFTVDTNDKTKAGDMTTHFVNTRKTNDLELTKVVTSPVIVEKTAPYKLVVQLKPVPTELKYKVFSTDTIHEGGSVAKQQGSTYEVTFDSTGKAEVYVCGGQTVTIKDLPTEVRWTVTEPDYGNDFNKIFENKSNQPSPSGTDTSSREEDSDNTNTSDTSVSDTIRAGTEMVSKAEITNMRLLGELEVEKTVASAIDSDKQQDFWFKVEIDSTKTIEGKKYGEADNCLSFEHNVAYVKLKNGETAKAIGLPRGINYTVTELKTLTQEDFNDIPDSLKGSATTLDTAFDTNFYGNFNTSWKKTVGASITESTTENKTMAEGSVAADKNRVNFTNTRKTGELELSKTVSSPFDTEKNDYYFFKVAITKNTESITINDTVPVMATYEVKDTANATATMVERAVTFNESGEAVIPVQCGRKVTLSGLPIEATYTVTEVPDTEHNVSNSTTEQQFEPENKYNAKIFEKNDLNQTGQISSGTAMATISNTRKEQPVSLVKVSSKKLTNDGYDTLSGAVFRLQQCDDDGKVSDSSWSLKLKSDSKGIFTEESTAGDSGSSGGSQSSNSAPSVSDDGTIVLPVGKYLLTEETAPAGYNMLLKPIIITVSALGVTYDQTDYIDATNGEWTTKTDADGTKLITLHIANSPGVELPSTGGPGTTIFTILGSILIALAGILLIFRKRRTV